MASTYSRCKLHVEPIMCALQGPWLSWPLFM